MLHILEFCRQDPLKSHDGMLGENAIGIEVLLEQMVE